MKRLLALLPFHKTDNPFWGYFFNAIKLWTIVARFYVNICYIDFYSFIFVFNSCSKKLLFVSFKCQVVLVPCVFVLWLHLADWLKFLHSLLHLPKSHISLTFPVETLHVFWVQTKALARIVQCYASAFHPKICQWAITVVDGLSFIWNLTKDGFSIPLNCLSVLELCKSVSYQIKTYI